MYLRAEKQISQPNHIPAECMPGQEPTIKLRKTAASNPIFRQLQPKTCKSIQPGICTKYAGEHRMQQN
jgi:hypothetical protein